jgi:hypothetical protein
MEAPCKIEMVAPTCGFGLSAIQHAAGCKVCAIQNFGAKRVSRGHVSMGRRGPLRPPVTDCGQAGSGLRGELGVFKGLDQQQCDRVDNCSKPRRSDFESSIPDGSE